MSDRYPRKQYGHLRLVECSHGPYEFSYSETADRFFVECGLDEVCLTVDAASKLLEFLSHQLLLRGKDAEQDAPNKGESTDDDMIFDGYWSRYFDHNGGGGDPQPGAAGTQID